MHEKVISPASFSRALTHLVGIGTLSPSDAVNFRYGRVPGDFLLPLPHGGVLCHSPKGYMVRGPARSFQADLVWTLA